MGNFWYEVFGKDEEFVLEFWEGQDRDLSQSLGGKWGICVPNFGGRMGIASQSFWENLESDPKVCGEDKDLSQSFWEDGEFFLRL